ncbi:hypothetical protein Pla123a_44440 [Posidoniimonas polymericola]|uniref:Lipoprotein n=1 Tax=Posidoniimonas polymericola TaxID=2528002 RepID=A0A5C5XYK0_9BACT|nr:hypothetical protein [Posidoniimonas polymericola]TWT67015.1 hypothetical protein Pla123a_44440 [Posidoniimonas polymericola]
MKGTTQPMRDLTKTVVALLILAPTVMATTGCANWRQSGAMKLARKVDIPNGIPWRDDEPRAGAPRSMVATWTDAVRQQPGEQSERGFGGRIFFYEHDESSPIKVDGQLVVYAFDETGRLPTDNRPTKRYVFPAEQFSKHESSSELGVSYSFWLPWDHSGGAQTEVSLIARFEPTSGGTLVVSEQTRQRLPGVMDGAVETMIAGQETPNADQPQGVRPVSYKQESPGPASYPSAAAITETATTTSGMQTTTIKLPTRPRRLGQ